MKKNRKEVCRFKRMEEEGFDSGGCVKECPTKNVTLIFQATNVVDYARRILNSVVLLRERLCGYNCKDELRAEKGGDFESSYLSEAESLLALISTHLAQLTEEVG